MSNLPEPAPGTENVTSTAADDETQGPDATTHPGAPPLDDLDWEVAYDRESISQFLAEVETERTRLLNEIAAVRSWLAQGEEQAAARRAAAQGELGELVLAAQAELAAIEREQQEMAAGIRAAAKAEATRVLEAARAEAAAIRGATVSLSTLVNGGSARDRVVGGAALSSTAPEAHVDAG